MAGESVYERGMEEAPENGKELSHSARANGMNECSGDSILTSWDNLLLLSAKDRDLDP